MTVDAKCAALLIFLVNQPRARTSRRPHLLQRPSPRSARAMLSIPIVAYAPTTPASVFSTRAVCARSAAAPD